MSRSPIRCPILGVMGFASVLSDSLPPLSGVAEDAKKVFSMRPIAEQTWIVHRALTVDVDHDNSTADSSDDFLGSFLEDGVVTYDELSEAALLSHEACGWKRIMGMDGVCHDCLFVDFVTENPLYHTCRCVAPGHPCLATGECVEEPEICQPKEPLGPAHPERVATTFIRWKRLKYDKNALEQTTIPVREYGQHWLPLMEKWEAVMDCSLNDTVDCGGGGAGKYCAPLPDKENYLQDQVSLTKESVYEVQNNVNVNISNALELDATSLFIVRQGGFAAFTLDNYDKDPSLFWVKNDGKILQESHPRLEVKILGGLDQTTAGSEIEIISGILSLHHACRIGGEGITLYGPHAYLELRNGADVYFRGLLKGGEESRVIVDPGGRVTFTAAQPHHSFKRRLAEGEPINCVPFVCDTEECVEHMKRTLQIYGCDDTITQDCNCPPGTLPNEIVERYITGTGEKSLQQGQLDPETGKKYCPPPIKHRSHHIWNMELHGCERETWGILEERATRFEDVGSEIVLESALTVWNSFDAGCSNLVRRPGAELLFKKNSTGILGDVYLYETLSHICQPSVVLEENATVLIPPDGRFIFHNPQTGERVQRYPYLEISQKLHTILNMTYTIYKYPIICQDDVESVDVDGLRISGPAGIPCSTEDIFITMNMAVVYKTINIRIKEALSTIQTDINEDPKIDMSSDPFVRRVRELQRLVKGANENMLAVRLNVAGNGGWETVQRASPGFTAGAGVGLVVMAVMTLAAFEPLALLI